MNEYAQWNVKGHRNTVKERCLLPTPMSLPCISFVCLHFSNFSNYKARFSMPGSSEGLWYSFNLGPAHFISISTEVYYFLEYGLKLVIKQYEWLEQDLKVCLLNMTLYLIFALKNTHTHTHVHISCTHNMFVISVPNCRAWLYEAKMKIMTQKWQ